MKIKYSVIIILFNLFIGCTKNAGNFSEDLLPSDSMYLRVESRFIPKYAINRFDNEVNILLQKNDINTNQSKIIFYGSSTFSIWQSTSLKTDMSPHQVLGQAFGGSTFPELLYYRQKLITPYNPKAIVIYCENDLFNNDNKTIQQTVDDFTLLVIDLHNRLPSTFFFIISLKPSPARRNKWNDVKKLNTLIGKVCNTYTYLKYIDINQEMFLPNGQIDGSLFTSDSLHLNSKGYKLWTKIIKPLL